MLASSARTLPRGAEWTYEVKWDGYRVIAVKDGSRVRIVSRNLKDLTRVYPSIATAVSHVRASSALIDGELVALDETGRPTFQALHHQTAGRAPGALVYYAFDLLHHDGKDLLGTPLESRRAMLADVVEGTPVLQSVPLPGTADQIAETIRRFGLEGIVAKKRRSLYAPGKRTTAWVKVKFNRRQDFVVGGFKPGGRSFESLVVGYYDGPHLYFAGRVRAGLTPHARAEIFPAIARDRISACPFVNLPSAGGGHWSEGVTEADMTKLRWVKPRLVVEVSFVEWTRDGNLRHSEFVGVRPDIAAREVRREP
jgi:bifunctional non-homologous end joining protein LigD